MRKMIPMLMLVAASAAQAGGTFQAASPDIAPDKPMEKGQEYDGFGCTGANVSPALNWRGAPDGTKSYAVTMYDPDAPTGSGWWHWIMIDIPAKATGLPSGAGNPARGLMPAGVSLRRNDFGSAAYGGACPPPGAPAHRYTIRVYALDVERLDPPAEGSAALVGYLLNQHALATAEIVTTYGR